MVKPAEVISLFRVNEDVYKVNGYGQEAADAILDQFRGNKIFFVGFLISGKLQKFI